MRGTLDVLGLSAVPVGVGTDGGSATHTDTFSESAARYIATDDAFDDADNAGAPAPSGSLPPESEGSGGSPQGSPMPPLLARRRLWRDGQARRRVHGLFFSHASVSSGRRSAGPGVPKPASRVFVPARRCSRRRSRRPTTARSSCC